MKKEKKLSTVRVERDERGVVRILFDRADQGNPFDELLIQELTSLAQDLHDDRKARVVILSGEGDVFCSGGNPAWLETLRAMGISKNVKLAKRLDRMFREWSNLPKPVIARVNGDAIAGGTGLVAVSDIVIAVEGVRFGFSDVQVGVAPAVVAPYFIKKVGYSFARAVFLTCEKFDAARAYSVGLVHEVVPRADLDKTVEATVDQCLLGAPEALAVAKQIPDKVLTNRTGLKRYLRHTVSEMRLGKEGREGLDALIAKRKPRWVSQETP